MVDPRRRRRLAMLFTLMVTGIILATVLLTLLVTTLLCRTGVIRHWLSVPQMIALTAMSVVLGAIVAALVGRCTLKPLIQLMEAADAVAAGNYGIRLQIMGISAFRQAEEKFNHMVAALDRSDNLREAFINDFSHEFKTPIVSILGFAKALKWENLTPEERAEYLDIIIEESQRLSDLAENMLTMSRAERSATLDSKVDFDLSEELRQAIAIIDSRWSEKNMDFVLEGEKIHAQGHPQLLRQVWLNLLDNAVKFSPQGGTVEVTVRQTGKTVQVTVADRGIGMTPEIRERAFDKFYQGDPSRSTKGNGLGLALVKRIVDLHGGTVEAAERPGGGSVFIVTL